MRVEYDDPATHTVAPHATAINLFQMVVEISMIGWSWQPDSKGPDCTHGIEFQGSPRNLFLSHFKIKQRKVKIHKFYGYQIICYSTKINEGEMLNDYTASLC